MKREAEKKVENLENRDTARIDHTSSLQVQDIASEKIYKARMFNYSKEGIYFESDSVLNPGIQIYIGIQNSKLASLADKQDLQLNDKKEKKDLRKHPRRPYDQFTLFTTHTGIFLMSESTLEVGQILTLVLPCKNGKDVKVKGEIVWSNDKGFGVKFLSIDKKSSPPKKQ
jgi:Tfp pilus assembly protein PilZ